MPRDWLNKQAELYHRQHHAVHPKAHPFGWGVSWDGQLYHNDGTPHGFIIFASIHFTKWKGEFGYPGLPSKWQVLNLSRMWLHDELPRNSETVVISKALRMVQRRWLEVHPPVDLAQPYHVVKVISYADTRFHGGTIYKAANFRYGGLTKPRKRGNTATRGEGMPEPLMRFVYDLPVPRWSYELPVQLPLFDMGRLAA